MVLMLCLPAVYRAPLLYVVHQSAIEVVEIRPDSFTKVSPDSDSDSEAAVPVRAATITLHSPCHLGQSSPYEYCLCTVLYCIKIDLLYGPVSTVIIHVVSLWYRIIPNSLVEYTTLVFVLPLLLTLSANLSSGPAAAGEGILVVSSKSDKLEVLQVLANFPVDMELNSTWGSLPCFSINQ